jgi:hypothetical protein
MITEVSSPVIMQPESGVHTSTSLSSILNKQMYTSKNYVYYAHYSFEAERERESQKG